MGKVIKKKLNGMSWWMKTSLILLLTMATTVFMYQGWYLPKDAKAATSIYYVTASSGTSVGIDGTTNVPAATAVATAPPVRALLGAALSGTADSYRPTAGFAAGTWTTAMKVYSDAFTANGIVLSGVSSTLFTCRGTTTGDQWRFNLYDYNPAGTAGNKTLVATSSILSTTLGGANDAFAPTYTIAGTGTVAQGHRLLLEIDLNPVSGTNSPRIYFGSGGASNFTITYTNAVTDVTAPTAGTVTVTPDVSTTFTSAAPTITTIFTDAESAVSSCQYTTNGGTNWYTGNVTGTGPYTCTAAPTGLTGSLSINMRATSGGGTGTATAITRSVDATVPTDGTLSIVSSNAQNQLTWTAATDPGGSGLSAYILRFATGATAPASCAAGTAVSGSPFGSAILTTTHTGLTNGTQYSYRLCAQDSMGNQSGGVTGSGTPVACTDTDLATLSITAPISAATVKGTTTVSMSVGTETAPAGLTAVQFQINGSWRNATWNSGNSRWEYSWNSFTDYPTSNVTPVTGVTINAHATDPDCGTVVVGTAVTVTVDNSGPVANITMCTQCHNGYPSLTDAATRNGSPGAFPGSHSVGDHGTDCTVCHVSNTLVDHSNGTIEMAASINGGTYGKGSSWLATNTPTTTPASLISCSATSCHGTISPAWGTVGAGGCVTCHSPVTATSSFTTTAGTTNTAKSTIHVSHLNKSHNMRSAAFACTECHIAVSNFSDPGHITGQLPASVTMTSDLAKGLPKLAATPLSPSFNGTACSNTWCHGAGLASNATPPVGVVLTPTFGTTLLTGTASNDCGKCHGYPPQSSDHIKTAPSTYYVASECKSCHPHVLADGSGFETTGAETIAKHIDGNIDASGGSCTGCHKSGGSGYVNGRTAVTEQFNTAGNSHHVQSAAATVDVKACYACHWEANSDGSVNSTYHIKSANQPVNLVVWNATTRPTTYTVGTTAVEYLSGGTTATLRTELAKISTQCTGCHNLANKAVTPFAAAGDTSTTAKYAWDGIDINTKWVQAGTTPWGKFNFSGGTTPIGGTNAKNGLTKAYSAHNNAANNAMGGPVQTDTTITNISGSTNVLCFDCHNSHGSSVAGVTSQYSSATGRNKGGLIKDVVANRGGYVTTYKPVGHTAGTPTGNKATTAAGATLCFDCHNSAAGTLTAGYTDSGTAPWGYQTFNAAQALPLNGYLDTPYFGAFIAPAASRVYTSGTNYKAGVANAKAMPLGGHYGTSVVGTPVTAITKQAHTTTITAGLQGLCTPCHDPHGVTTNPTFVPTQANAVPLLKGTWVTSPYKEDKADIAVQRGGGSRFAGFNGGGAIPGYHIDQNTLIVQPNPTGSGGATTASARSAMRAQQFAPFTNAASSQQTFADTNFAGLCIQCHAKTALTNATAPAAGNWKTTARIHQSVKGWAATTGTNANNVVHAYTCSKCHAPHTSRLPRLLVTNCLDVKHFKQNASSTGTIPTTAGGTVVGNVSLPATSGGSGRFPAGGGLHKTQWATAFNPGPWWFQQTNVNGTVAYGSNCHNATNAGGTAYNPTNQMWNNRSSW